jgi:hypothetical protein
VSKYRSEEINLLTEALAKAQGIYEPLEPNEDVAGGKFANLTAILEATRTGLSTNGLTFFQHIEIIDEGSGASLLWTTIAHSSGQYHRSCSRIVQENTFRETFQAIERYKRLNALMLLGIAPTGLDPLMHDDNGVYEAERQMVKNIKNPIPKPKSQNVETISKAEYDGLMFDLEGYAEIAKSIQDKYDITTIADLPRSEIWNVKEHIRRVRKLYEEEKSATR